MISNQIMENVPFSEMTDEKLMTTESVQNNDRVYDINSVNTVSLKSNLVLAVSQMSKVVLSSCYISDHRRSKS